jgi:hypothetical protein
MVRLVAGAVSETLIMPKPPRKPVMQDSEVIQRLRELLMISSNSLNGTPISVEESARLLIIKFGGWLAKAI